MKKISLIAFVFLGIISLRTNSVLATSGTCSSHGGVNCSAGAGLYGNAICNDGWTSSSVSYSSIQECSNTQSLPCPSPIIVGATEISLCDSYQKICDQQNASLQQESARDGGTYTSQNCSQAVSCRQEVANYNAEMQSYNQCVSEAFKVLQTIQQAENSIQQPAIQQVDKSSLDSIAYNKVCKMRHGQYSIFSTSTTLTCECKQGYILDSADQCVLTPSTITPEVTEKVSSVVVKIKQTPILEKVLNTNTTPTDPKVAEMRAFLKEQGYNPTPIAGSSSSVSFSWDAYDKAMSGEKPQPANNSGLENTSFFGGVWNFIKSFF